MANHASSQRIDGTKKTELQDSLKVESNLSGLKHVLHGASYQLKLGMIVSLANAKKSLDPANGFSFAVVAEDPTAGKFDDIVYTFKDGGKTGIVKIQVKHKLGLPAPDITLSEFTTGKDSSNPFAILKYFSSFCDQVQSTTDLEGFVICTNADINDKAKSLWQTVEPAVTNDSAPSLDSYVSSLFDSIEGKYYQLDFIQLSATNGVFSNLYQLLRKCSKRARLAKLLIEATKPNKKITCNNSLFKEYRQAILDVIDSKETSTNDSYGFRNEFLVLSSSNSNPDYEAFRKEFEEQYRGEFKIDGCVWDDLKLKRVYVSKDYLSDEKNNYTSSYSFPNDNVDESLNFFCERLRLVCGTVGEHELDEAIARLWRNLHNDDNHLVPSHGYNEGNIATDRLFKTNFDWLMDPFAKPLLSDDIKKDLGNIKGTLAHMKLESISDKLRKKVVGSPFRISANVLQDSVLYYQIESENILAFETFDIQFGITVLLDILELQSKDHTTALFLDDFDFCNNSDTLEAVIRCNEPSPCLVILCYEAYKMVHSIVWKWKKNIPEVSRKNMFLIRKIENMSSDLDCFRLCDLTEESWAQFRNKNITLCETTISPAKIFHKRFRELSIEEIIKIMKEGKQMEESNKISIKYHEIARTYVHRSWIDEQIRLEAENIPWSKESSMIKSIKEPQQEEFSFKEITNRLKIERNFDRVFGKTNSAEEDCEPIVDDEGKKVLILLGEAGFGKSTSITRLAWDLRKRNHSSWVIRCNLSDHCSDFKPFTPGLQKNAGKSIDETEAVKMLYKLIYLSFQPERKIAETCAKCLVLLEEEACVIEELMKHYDLSLNSSIQLLVFKEKFNAGELVLLLDGFDEIAPHYKEVVLKFLSHFVQFKGVSKLYLTSRPYDFKEQFNETFKDPMFFQLKPLSLQDKGSMLYKMMKVQWHNGNIEDDEISDFYKSLCYMLICILGDITNVPLNLMMAVDIVGDSDYQNENINRSSKTFNAKLFKTILDISKPSFIVEEFVKVKIRHLLYDKNGRDKNVADKPLEMERFEKAIDEAKLLNGLLALRVLFSNDDRRLILSDKEMRQTDAYAKKLHEGGEKVGIIHSIHDGYIMFIHRSFVEYLAAWWVIQRQMNGKRQDTINISCQASFWDLEREELRVHIDTILARNHPLNLAIIERDWRTVESLLSTNPQSLYEKDDGGRTGLHLIAFYYDFGKDWPHFLPDHIDSNVINCKEALFGWTALDNMFHSINAYEHVLLDDENSESYPRFFFYLLHHGASINFEVLYEQVVSAGYFVVRKAARYSRYVMGYLSRQVIEYESHDYCKKMKEFCDKVVAYLFTSANLEQMLYSRKYEYYEDDVSNENKIITEFIWKDSAWMLESLITQNADVDFFEMIRNSYFELAVKKESIFVVIYFMANNPSILNDEHLWNFAVFAALKDYKIEFKYFFDLYCIRLKIKDFQPCSIKSDKAYYLNHCFKSFIIDKVCDFSSNICWAKLEIPTETMIDKEIVSLLVICVATVRPSMLKYLKESCMLNLCSGLVYCLAVITDHLLSQIDGAPAIKPSKAFEGLLDLASNISDVEANNMLRLAIRSNLFQFSICLIERYNISFQTDELKDLIVARLCTRYESSFWVEEPHYDFYNAYVGRSKTDLLRYMLENEKGMNCFDIFDKKGRSILHLSIENDQTVIVEHIVAQKLGLNQLSEIERLGVESLPNITFLYHAIQEIVKSVGEEWWHYKVLIVLAKQIGKIAITIQEESEEPNNGRLLIEQHADEFYQIAMKYQYLLLLYYLNHKFPAMDEPCMYDAHWLASISIKWNSPDCFDVDKILLCLNETDERVDLYKIVDQCYYFLYDMTFVNLKRIIKLVDAKLSANRSMEEVRIINILTFAVYMKNESMIKYLCEALKLNFSWNLLIDIMVIVHHAYTFCFFDEYAFELIYKYLFSRTSNLGEPDAEGRNVLHLAAQSGLGCLAKFLIKCNISDVMITNVKNGWSIYHYYASSKRWNCCDTENDTLLTCITKRWLKVTPLSYVFLLCSAVVNRNKAIKSALHVAVEAGNIETAQYMIEYRLGINSIDQHEIRNSEECSRFRQCYDELSQIAIELPFNAKCDYLLHRLAKSIHRFLPENIKHITEQENAEDDMVEDACRVSIKYRSVPTLEHLIIAYDKQAIQALTRSNSIECVACMMECIRLNRSSMFKVLVGHYCTLRGIQYREDVDFENEEEDIDETMIDEDEICWSVFDEFTVGAAMTWDSLNLLILSIAYGRLSMARCLVEMLQLVVNKSLILLIVKALEKLWVENCKAATPVYEYLASRCEGNPNLLYLCAQAECYTVLEHLIKLKQLDPNVIDSETRWNVGHYIVSEPTLEESSEIAIKVFKLLLKVAKMDCFGVLDRNGRSILHLALENNHRCVVKHIINHRLGLKGNNQPWEEWDMKKIEKHFDELQQIVESLPESLPEQKQQVVRKIFEKVRDRHFALIAFKQLFTY